MCRISVNPNTEKPLLKNQEALSEKKHKKMTKLLDRINKINKVKKCKECRQFMINPIDSVNPVNLVGPVQKIKNCILNLKKKKFFSTAKSGINSACGGKGGSYTAFRYRTPKAKV